MKYPELVKYKAVDIYHKTKSISQVIEIIKKELEIKLSERIIFYWLKNKKYNSVKVDGGELLVCPDPPSNQNQKPTPDKQFINFDKEKFVQAFTKIFKTSNREMNALLKAIIEEIDPRNSKERKEEIKKMKLSELILIYERIIRLQTGQFNFVLDAMLKTNGSNPLDEIAKAFQQAMGEVPDNPEINEGELNK